MRMPQTNRMVGSFFWSLCPPFFVTVNSFNTPSDFDDCRVAMRSITSISGWIPNWGGKSDIFVHPVRCIQQKF